MSNANTHKKLCCCFCFFFLIAIVPNVRISFIINLSLLFVIMILYTFFPSSPGTSWFFPPLCLPQKRIIYLSPFFLAVTNILNFLWMNCLFIKFFMIFFLNDRVELLITCHSRFSYYYFFFIYNKIFNNDDWNNTKL